MPRLRRGVRRVAELDVGVAEHAGVEPDDGVLLGRAEAPGLGARGADALGARRPGDVAAAERLAVDDVRHVADVSGGVEGWRQGGVPGEGGGEKIDVGPVGGVLRVVAAGGIGPADRPRRRLVIGGGEWRV